MYSIQDVAKKVGAKAVGAVQAAGHYVEKKVNLAFGGEPSFHGTPFECRLQVHLQAGKQFGHEGQDVNVIARLELLGPGKINPGVNVFGDDGCIDRQQSEMQV